MVGVCEKGSKFVSLYQKDANIDRVFQVRAGKYRRYGGVPLWKRLLDFKTLFLNIRDVFSTIIGYFESKGLIKQLKPDAILIKGGFVAVPLGKAAARLGVPYITHDSDSTPGLANKLISKEAVINATGMPLDLYEYPKNKMHYVGIPLSDNFSRVSPALRASFRDKLGLSACSHVITVVGGSQGALGLNRDMASIAGRLMQANSDLGLVIIAGKAHEKEIRNTLKAELLANEFKHTVVKGFVDDMHVYSGAADIVITRAGATNTAEFALQALPLIMVPGRLAGGHQHKNAAFFAKKRAAIVVEPEDKEGLFNQVNNLLSDQKKRAELSKNLFEMAKPDAAKELARITLDTVQNQKK